MSWIGVLAEWTPGGRRDTGSNRIATRESAANSTGVEWVGGVTNLKSAVAVHNRHFQIEIEKKLSFWLTDLMKQVWIVQVYFQFYIC